MSIRFCLDAAEEESDLLLSGCGESDSLIPTKQSGYELVCIPIPAFAGTESRTVSCCDCRKPQKQFPVLSASSLWCSLIEVCFRKHNFQLPDTSQSLLFLVYSAINHIARQLTGFKSHVKKLSARDRSM